MHTYQLMVCGFLKEIEKCGSYVMMKKLFLQPGLGGNVEDDAAVH